MDWSVAKKILIAVFVLVNVFMAYNLKDFYFNQGISQNIIDNAQKILERYDVKIECEIPKYVGKNVILTMASNQLDKKKIIKGIIFDNDEFINNLNTLDTVYWKSKKIVFSKNGGFSYFNENPDSEVDLTSKKSIEQAIIAFIKNASIVKGNFVIDKFITDKAGSVTATLIDDYEGYFVFDNQITAIVGEKGIKSLSLKYRTPEGISYRKGNAINAYEILIQNYMSKKGITITTIDHGFRSFSVENSSKRLHLGLVWRVVTKDGSERFFDSYDGTEMID